MARTESTSPWSLGPGEAGLVSIIIPLHNRAGLVVRTLQSCLAQDYRPLEVVVVDDGSTDGSAAVAEAFRDRHAGADFRMAVLRQENSGQCAARNSALRASTGAVVTYLDSDDILPPGRTSLLLGALESAGADIAMGTHLVFRSDEELDALLRDHPASSGAPPEEVSPEPLLRFEPPIWHYVMRRKVAEEAGPWMEELRYQPDHEYIVRIRATQPRMVRVPDVVYYYRRHADSITSSDKPGKSLSFLCGTKEMYRTAERQGALGDVRNRTALEFLFRLCAQGLVRHGLKGQAVEAYTHASHVSGGLDRLFCRGAAAACRIPGVVWAASWIDLARRVERLQGGARKWLRRRSGSRA